jgi:hypothetical protein
MKLVAEKTFNLLKGFGYEVSSFNKEGDLVIDPMEATRFAVESPNILVRIDPLDKHLSLKTGTPGESIEKIRPMLKELAQDYLLDFDYSVFDKQIKPKGEKVDVAKKSKEEIQMSEDMNILKKLAGLEADQVSENPEPATASEPVQQELDLDGTKSTLKMLKLTVSSFMPDWEARFKKAWAAEQAKPTDPKQGPSQVAAVIRMTQEYNNQRMAQLKQDTIDPAFTSNVPSDYEDGRAVMSKESLERDLDEAIELAIFLSQKESVTEASLGKMTGSRKSSYQPLADNVKIIVRHNKDVNEEVRGARSRNIHSILIQRGEEKFKMAENNLSAARAMARHLHNGGETFDEIGESITEMSREFKKLKEFMSYVKKANLVNETNEEFVSMALENIDTIRTNFKRLSGVKTYANAVESVTAYNNVEILQDDIDLESKFTETHFDDKVANVMDTLKASASRKNSFENKITRAIELESFEGLKDLLKEDDLLEFETMNQQLGHKVSSLGYSAKDETLGNYLHSISSKLNAGGQLSQFEYGAIKSSLLSAGQHNVQNAPMNIEESYEAFMDRFVD